MIYLDKQIITKTSSAIHLITKEQIFFLIIKMISSIEIIIHLTYLMLHHPITYLILIIIHRWIYFKNHLIILITFFNKTIIINPLIIKGITIVIYLINLLIYLINNKIIIIFSIVKISFPTIIISLIQIIYLINHNNPFSINLFSFSIL